MNLKIKFREGFRPFAPSVLGENVADYFEIDRPSPYMLLVAYVRPEKRRKMKEYVNPFAWKERETIKIWSPNWLLQKHFRESSSRNN